MGDDERGREGTEVGSAQAEERQAGEETGAARRASVPAEPAASPSATEAAALAGLNAVRRHAERSALYHKAREGALDSFHRASMAIVVMASSGAFYAVTKNVAVAPLVALVPVAVAAIDVAYGPGIAARVHAILARDFLDLAADAAENNVATSRVADLEARLYRLYAAEPPTYKAVDALCQNQVCDAMGRREERLAVSFYHRLLRHVLRFSGTTFERAG